jgi:hypothetical protein
VSESFFTSRCPHCHQLIEVITEPQKVAFQLMCLDIDRGRDWPEGSGHRIGAKKWKQLIILAWERYHERDAEILPAIDGDGFDVVYRRDSRLSKPEASEILAFTDAWMAERGIKRSRSFAERTAEPF